MNEKIVGVLLCAGKGLRLGKLTQSTPKPLLRIENLPFQSTLNYSIHKLLKYGVDDLIIITGYLGDKIDDYVSSNVRSSFSEDLTINVIDSEGEYQKGPLYSLLSIKKHSKLLNENSILLIIPGDTIFQESLFQVIIKIIKSIPSTLEEPLIFYKTVKKKDLTKKFKYIKDISEKNISCVKFFRLSDKFDILSEIYTRTLSKIRTDDIINEIFPIFVLPFSKFKLWINLAERHEVKSIKNLANYYCKSKHDILAIKLKKALEFYDIDFLSDMKNLEKKIEMDNRFQ
ncbi:MAG: NTP transferase domain-containing protein [Candidatus Lokiarchaeota archaeon]|nr:NTP transferase domain-containing protein [Candidatus Lokiarchaeota archaeon]MBD3198813.1 NTP transferase domain-containing protein [Candidatus Lokiarchaeota archaeon]